MRNKDKILSIIIVIIFLYVIANIGAINSFLTFATDKTVDFGHTQYVVPEAWNTTQEFNLTSEAKTNHSFTNDYVIWDVWEDWPEDHITSISREKLKSMENGNYQVLNSSTVKLGGVNVSKEYFTNPTRDTETQWDHIGLTYVFPREDTNYAVQIHYFTDIDYDNQSYQKEVDDRLEDFMANIHNKNYDGFISALNKIKNFCVENFEN